MGTEFLVYQLPLKLKPFLEGSCVKQDVIEEVKQEDILRVGGTVHSAKRFLKFRK